jgi:hypothetical protein
MYLKISKNILESISSFEKIELNKVEFNNNLFLNISFLTKFAAGKNIQENPNFSCFISKKSSLLNNQIANNLQKENINIDLKNKQNDNNNNYDNEDFPLDTENYPRNDNNDLDQNNIENITEKIEDNFRLETGNSTSIFNENLDETINLNKFTHNIIRDINDFDARSKFVQGNNDKNLINFDFEHSYNEEMSTIYHNETFSEFKDQSVFDPNLSVILKKGSVENLKYGANAYMNCNETTTKHKSQYKYALNF